MVGVHSFLFISFFAAAACADIRPSSTHGRHIVRFSLLRDTHLALRG